MVLRDHLFSVNLVSKPRMLSVSTVYVLGSLHVVMSMDFHPVAPDADTIFECFDENAVFKEWRRTKILLEELEEHCFWRFSCAANLVRLCLGI